MCPPTFVVEFALTTIAIAFQRIRLLMRFSTRQSPGYFGSFSTGMVLTYGVVNPADGCGAERNCPTNFSSNSAVRSGPWLCKAISKTDCSDSPTLSPLPFPDGETEWEREP